MPYLLLVNKAVIILNFVILLAFIECLVSDILNAMLSLTLLMNQANI